MISETMRFTQPTPGPAAQIASSAAACVPVLRGDRVTLRAVQLSDYAAFCDIVCTDHGQFIGGQETPSSAWYGFAPLCAGWMLHGHGGWAVEVQGETAGFVLIGLEPGDQEPELGFFFCKTFEGKGLAFEAATLALAYAQTALQLPSLVSYIDPENTRSVALAKRLGAWRDGHVNGSDVYRHSLDADGDPEAYA